MWNTISRIIKDAAKDTIGVAISTSKTHTTRRESWWPRKEAQSKAAVKHARFRELLSCQEDRIREHERERKRRDLGDIMYIKDEGGRTIVDEEEIKKIWGKYFSSLYNMKGSEGRDEVVSLCILSQFECYYSRISHAEVRTALQNIKRNKAVGPDQIPIEVWRCLGNDGVIWLTSVFNKIFKSAKMPDVWRLNDVIHIYKKKAMLKEIHLIRSLMERYRERQRDLHMAFLDLEKDYDSVIWELIWRTLIDEGTPRIYIRLLGICTMVPGPVLGIDGRVKQQTRELKRSTRSHRLTDVEIRIGDKILQPKESFRYLGSMIHKSGRIDKDGSHRIKAVQLKWRAASGVLGRPNLRWEDKLKHDMKELLLYEDMTSNRNEWRARIRLGDRATSVVTNARQIKGKLRGIFSNASSTSPGTMLLNLDQLEKQLAKEEFQEIRSFNAFRHKREYDRRVNDRKMQTKEGKVDSSKALDAGLVVIESNGTESEKHVTSSKSRNDTHAEDADIKPVNNKEPMAEVQMTAKYNVLSNGQQHAEQPEFKNEGRVDQVAKQYQVKSPFLGNDAKDKKFDIDVIETINIELEHSVAKLLAENEQLHKENEHLKQTYKELCDSIKKTCIQNKDNSDSLISQINQKSVKNANLKAQIQEKVFANATFKNELRKLKGNSVDTKFSKASIFGKPPLQPSRNHLVVRQPNAFKSERPRISKSWFASQVDDKNNLSKTVNPHYLPKVKESAFVKPHHVIAPNSSRNSKK
ncbi:hypothetical protein Tco_1275631 [Tanacetum coccineum]